MALSDSLTPELLELAAEGDGALRDRAARLVTTMFDEIEHQMRTAPANTRHTLMQKVLPILAKMREGDRANEAITNLREEMDSLQLELSGLLLNGHELVPDEDLPELPTDLG